MKKLVLLASAAAVAVTAALPAAALEMGPPREADDRAAVHQVQAPGDLKLQLPKADEVAQPREADDRGGDVEYGPGLLDLGETQFGAPREADDRGDPGTYGQGDLIDFGDSRFDAPREADDRA